MREQLQNTIESTLSLEEQERLKRAVCGFFKDKLTELEITSVESPSGYVQQFYKLCTGSARPWTQEKEFDLLGLAAPLRIRFDRHSGYQPELKKMSINIEPLLQAGDTNGLREAALSILEDVYHEAEHIFFPVDLEEYLDPDATPDEWIKYATQTNEINSCARQFAFRYSVEYPNESFTLEKMQALAEHLKTRNPGRAFAYNYFVVFADPKKQDQYKHIVNLAEAHRAIVLQTERHLELLKRNT